MTYTLLLDGQVLGETDFAHAGPSPAQRLGMLRPTPHGLKVLPSVAGFLTATLNLKHAMTRRGLRDREGEGDAMLDALENTPEGLRVRELAKMLDALELRDDTGQCVTFTSIAVSDLNELRLLSEQVGSEWSEVTPADDFQASCCYLISATFATERAVRLPAPTTPGWRPHTNN